MKNLFLCVICLGIFCCSGCATKSSFEPIALDTAIPSSARYNIGQINDISGFRALNEDIVPAQTMKDALETALIKAGLLGGDYKINVRITEYEPGNAFKRWLLPCYGGTYLKTESTILNPENKEIALIPVNRDVVAGGGFTIGAWRECFHDVAEEIVKILKREMSK